MSRRLRRALNHVRGSQNIEPLIASGLRVGDGGMVLDRSYLEPRRPWLIKIGAQVGISSYVRVLSHDDSLRIQTGLTRISPVEIGDRVFVGVGSWLLPGARIGADSVIAAGAVVGGEVPPGSMVAGHPARVITTTERLLAWQRAAMTNAPVWPMEGWTRGRGITAERKARQREALATVREGYAARRDPRRVIGPRVRLAEMMTAACAVRWRDLRPRALRRLIVSRLRGNRTVERHVRDGLQLGQRVFIAEEAFLDPGRPWLITIGEDSFISVHVIIFAHDSGLNYQQGLTRIGRVDIGRRVYVGPGALILPGSQIGDGSIIEGGAVVRGAIPPGSYVAGNPATVLSDTASILEDCRRALANGPAWPREGWSRDTGITEKRKQAQREALSTAPEGFLLDDARVTGRESAGSDYGRESAASELDRPLGCEQRRGLGSSVTRVGRRIVSWLRAERDLDQLLTDGLVVGRSVSIARRAYLDPSYPWLITIGDRSVISEFAIVMTHDPRTNMLIGATRLARVVIGCRVFIGPGAIVLPGTTIGDDSVIDVRAVVSGEIPARSFVSGNPGRVVGGVEDMAERCRQAAAERPIWPDAGSHAGRHTLDHVGLLLREGLGETTEGYVRTPARPASRSR